MVGPSMSGAVDLSSLRRPEPVPNGEGASSTPVLEITEQNLNQVVQESTQKLVFVLFCADAAPACADVLQRLTQQLAELAPSAVLATVAVDRHPAVASAFGISAVPALVAVLHGQPFPLLQGSPDDTQLRQVLTEVIAAAQQSGIDATQGAENVVTEEEIPETHQAALAAIDAGDFAAAIAAYDQALRENPKDYQAKAGRAQVALLERLEGINPQQIRTAAAQPDAAIAAHLAVADLDVSTGHVEDGFDRLLTLLRELPVAEKDVVRLRLLELFEVVGTDDPRVVVARQQLATALF